MCQTPCNHGLIVIGAHPSFATGWICMSCGAKLGDLRVGKEYAVVIAAIRRVRCTLEAGYEVTHHDRDRYVVVCFKNFRDVLFVEEDEARKRRRV